MMISCKEASRLMSQGLDRDLGLGQRASLRLHLFICTSCSRMRKQLDFLHRAALRPSGHRRRQTADDGHARLSFRHGSPPASDQLAATKGLGASWDRRIPP